MVKHKVILLTNKALIWRWVAWRQLHTLMSNFLLIRKTNSSLPTKHYTGLFLEAFLSPSAQNWKDISCEELTCPVLLWQILCHLPGGQTETLVTLTYPFPSLYRVRGSPRSPECSCWPFLTSPPLLLPWLLSHGFQQWSPISYISHHHHHRAVWELHRMRRWHTVQCLTRDTHSVQLAVIGDHVDWPHTSHRIQSFPSTY